MDRDIDRIIAYRDELLDCINHYEKETDNRLTYISAGSLALVMTYISTQSNISHIILFIIGGICMVLSLLMNISSFYVSKHILRKVVSDIDQWHNKGKPKKSKPDIDKIATETIKKIDRYNLINGIILFTGIIVLSSFVTINQW